MICEKSGFKRLNEKPIFIHERLVVNWPEWDLWNSVHTASSTVYHNAELLWVITPLCSFIPLYRGLKTWLKRVGKRNCAKFQGKHQHEARFIQKGCFSSAVWKSKPLSSVMITADMTRRQSPREAPVSTWGVHADAFRQSGRLTEVKCRWCGKTESGLGNATVLIYIKNMFYSIFNSLKDFQKSSKMYWYY